MFILGEYQRESEWGQSLSQTSQRQPRDLFPFNPNVGGLDLDAAVDQWACHSELLIKLERSSGDGQCAGRSSWLGSLIDHAYGDAKPGQPECEHEAGGACPDNQDRDVGCRSPDKTRIDCHGIFT